MSISSVNSGGSTMMRAMQRPDPSKMAEDLFSKLDTKGQGYIEKSDLEAALGNVSQSGGSSSSSVADEMFSKLDGDGDGKVTKEEMSATIQKIASELDGPAPRARMQGGQGGMPPPPPSGGAQGAGSTDSASSSSESSDPADANGDGTVTIEESLAYEASQASSGTDTASTSDADGQLMQMLAGGMPPPPKDGGPNDQGFTKDQLTSMVQELGSKDSERAKLMSDIAGNFDAADTDGDGKVNGSEARAFEESKNASGAGSGAEASSSASSADARFMKQMMQLLHAYSDPNQTAESNSFSTSV
ncbi:EF hand domain-containing protein [Methylobacter tundripaludum]|jgi:Ca2+-binding EF-hand superfamily protein|uniref:EF hand domain-containing protein n=1 Tax=Methylobacter tundripaludum TaxID=173365 RepID=A0A2S6GNW4_9GAMM|nr:EF-hand domain-containing protein [Methylobacter tundripaludum]PPK66924.1 EF hand domain-containing protein [Methylobacter tundripaludum]